MYAYSIYGRPFVGCYDTLEECKLAAIEEMEEDSGDFDVGELKPHTISDFVDAEDILERIDDLAVQEDLKPIFDRSISIDEIAELGDAIGKVIEDYARKFGWENYGYTVENVQCVYFYRKGHDIQFANTAIELFKHVKELRI